MWATPSISEPTPEQFAKFREYLLGTMEIAEWIRLQECFRKRWEMRKESGIEEVEFTGKVTFE